MNEARCSFFLSFVRCTCLYISTFLCFVIKELSGAADGPPRERRRGRRDDGNVTSQGEMDDHVPY